MTNTITPAELAETFKSDGRTVRKFLRSITPKDEQPGKGSRWAIPGTKSNIQKLQKGFDKWTAIQAQEAADRATAKAAAAAEVAAVEEVEDDTELDS